MNDLVTKCMDVRGVTVKDAEQGLVEAVIARTGIVDRDGDVFLKGAFGTKNVRVSAYNHRSWPQRGGLPPVGRGTIREQGDEVVAEMKFFLGTAEGRDAFEVVKEMGDLQEWSYGFMPGSATRSQVTPELEKLGAKQAFKSVPVEEVSPVLLGASFGTRTVGVKECQSCGQPVPEDDDTEVQKGDEPSDCELKAKIEEQVKRFEAITARVS